MVSLVCIATHPRIPAIDLGVSIGISPTRDGGVMFHVPGTLNVLSAMIAALRDGAFAPPPTTDPYWDEMERLIFATRDQLLARAEAILKDAPAARLAS